MEASCAILLLLTGYFDVVLKTKSIMDKLWYGIVPNDLVSLTFWLFYGFYSFDVTRLMLLVNHGGWSFFTVITLLGMWVFAASIMAHIMLLVDISTSIHKRQLLSIRLKVTSVEYKKLSAYMMNGIWLDDSIPL